MLAVITAMQREADALLCRCSAQKSYRLCGKTVVLASACGREFHVVVCGVGKVNAAAGAQMAIDKLEADALLNIGVAGGISPRTALGKVFAIEKAVQYRFRSESTQPYEDRHAGRIRFALSSRTRKERFPPCDARNPGIVSMTARRIWHS